MLRSPSLDQKKKVCLCVSSRTMLVKFNNLLKRQPEVGILVGAISVQRYYDSFNSFCAASCFRYCLLILFVLKQVTVRENTLQKALFRGYRTVISKFFLLLLLLLLLMLLLAPFRFPFSIILSFVHVCRSSFP